MKIIEKTYDWAYEYGRRERTDHIILHHAAAEKCSADDVHRWHLQNGWAGIGYNYFVRKDGSVYRGRPADAVGAHTIGYNSVSVGVCFEGNFDREREMPASQLKAGRELVEYLLRQYPNAKISAHRNHDSTACPGKYFPYTDIVGVEKTDLTDSENKKNTKSVGKEVCKVEIPVLRRGESSGYVKTAQILMNKYNGAGLVEDGAFGEKTEAAVRAYQRDRGLEADGIVGSKTWTQLLK